MAAAQGARPSGVAFGAALTVLAALSVLGVYLASRLARLGPRIQGQAAVPASE